MNINKRSIEILLSSYIGTNIKAQLNGKGEKVEFYWHELLTEFRTVNNKQYLNIHFIYVSVYRNIDFEGQLIEDEELIEFTLSDDTDNSKESLEEMEEKTYIDKNCLYFIINLLKEL